jgi:hypothetical protein
MVPFSDIRLLAFRQKPEPLFRGIISAPYPQAKNVRRAKSAPVDAGDVWTWIAIDADSKLVPSWRIGERSSEMAIAFVDDLRFRLAVRPQITTDGHRAYLEAVESAFGGDARQPARRRAWPTSRSRAYRLTLSHGCYQRVALGVKGSDAFAFFECAMVACGASALSGNLWFEQIEWFR